MTSNTTPQSKTKNKIKHQTKSTALKTKKKRSKITLNLMGWNTTDNDEIERRRFRARMEPLKSKPLELDEGYFGTFLVFSKQHEKKYQVEIRSLKEHINSCNCPDYRTNGLGTCKHIEYVLYRLEKNRKRVFKIIAEKGSPRFEIYMDRREESKDRGEDHRIHREQPSKNTLRILWPKTIRPSSNIVSMLTPFFNEVGVLQKDLLVAYPKLQAILSKMKSAQKKQIRMSALMEDAIEHQRLRVATQKRASCLLTDLKAGTLNLDILKHPLYPYQEQGLIHLAVTERALLSDEMGLGKTVQAIAACELLHQTRGIKKVLVIATASLKAEWAEQIAKFTNQTMLTIQGTRPHRLKQYEHQAFFYLTNYEQILIDGPDIMRLLAPDVIILDEAQRIKNWQTKTANAVKMLKSPYAFVLTGTPLENRIDDIYSVIQFLDPHFFGPLFRFNRDFYQLNEEGNPIGYKNLDKLYVKLKSVMLRRCKHEVEGQLPERIVNTYFIRMEAEQRKRYDEYNDRVARLVSKGRNQQLRKEEYEKLQKWLACMRMLCDTPYILDQTCRISPKLDELKNILEELLIDPTAKIIIFSEWERMLQLVREHCEKMEIGYAWHTGKVPQHKRRQEINQFKNNPHCRLFLSTDAGSLGLNLQVANMVINLDLPWNPAKLEQRIARAWRKHQTRNVQVINLVCESSIEHRMLNLLSQKKILAQGVLEGLDNLKSMELPSGRAAFMERMESLMSPPTTEHAESTSFENNPPESFLNLEDETKSLEDKTKEILNDETDLSSENFDNPLESIDPSEAIQPSEVIETIKPLEAIQPLATNHSTLPNEDKALNRFSQQIKQLVEHSIQLANTASKNVLAIVEEPLERNAMLSQLNSKSLEGTFNVIDRTTFDIIQSLIKSGVLSLNNQVKIVSSSDEVTQSIQQIREEQINKAKGFLVYATRKHTLAKVLFEQTFLEESLVPLRESLESTIFAFSCLISTDLISTDENLTKGKISQQYPLIEKWVDQQILPRKTLQLWKDLNSNELSDTQLLNCLTLCKEINDYVMGFLEKFSHPVTS